MAIDPSDFEDNDAPGGAPEWMATFSDLCSLLLTFFVLLLSFANMDAKEFREMLGSAREAFGVQRAHKGHMMGLTTSLIEWSNKEAEPWTVLTGKEASALSSMVRDVQKRGLQDDLEVVLKESALVVRLKDRLAFNAGSDELNDSIKPVLDHVAELLVTFPGGLSIEGHTDNVPINSSRFPSNWELSAARASSVMRYMERKGPLKVDELRVTGYGDRKPLVANDSSAHRAMNRRVEFVFEREQPKKSLLGKPLDKDKNAEQGAEQAADAAAKPLLRLVEAPGGEAQGEEPTAYRVLPTRADEAAIEKEKARARGAEERARLAAERVKRAEQADAGVQASERKNKGRRGEPDPVTLRLGKPETTDKDAGRSERVDELMGKVKELLENRSGN